MTPEQTDLARRLVARPEWRWVEPMRHVWDGAEGGDDRILGPMDEQHTRRDGSVLPDLTDDATGGVLLGMLPVGAWKVGRWTEEDVLRHSVSWWCRPNKQLRVTPVCPTLAEAAARALLACWEAADGR